MLYLFSEDIFMIASSPAPESERVTSGVAPPYVTISTELVQLRSFADVRKTMMSFSGAVEGGQAESGQDNGVISPSISRQFHGNASRSPSVLCVWDVDDTFVTSGREGSRQHVLFETDNLLHTFGSCPARHLLLTRGSVDDLFVPGPRGGKLQRFTSFFTGDAKFHGDTPGGVKAKKGRVDGSCCSRPLVVTSVKKSPLDGSDVPIIRIATAHAPRKVSMGIEALFTATEQYTMEEDESCVRWLAFRPSLWGISLSSLSSLVVPSPHTAFLDGAIFRKMDIVRSLAVSGLWDVVFFVDNNLSELGVVRPGLGIGDYHRFKAAGELRKFFLSDFLLLRASSALADRSHRRHTPKLKVSGTCSPGSGALSCGELGSDNTFSQGNFIEVHREPGISGEESPGVSSGFGSAVEGYPKEDEQVVKIIVGHFHMEAEKFNMYKQLVPPAFQHEVHFSYHPAFSSGAVCRDEQIARLLEDFRDYEREILQGEEKFGFFGRPVPGWEPSIGLVRCLRPEYRKQLASLRDQYVPICRDINRIMLVKVPQLPVDERDHVMKRESATLYKRLVRQQLVVDPFLIERVALILFYISTVNHRILPSTLLELKKEIQALMNGMVPANGVLKKKCLSVLVLNPKGNS
ncbi:T. brucei spp.-specific protein [Trypanosoma brucei gambiense DAL972]|uniref:T. brucei spp.-specific protein n=1 Tax=Trypanosoma brucei gambiense (strain MHOM/CI/86/DAL972) TaxID=679716 RepID=D0AA99_TRYB9|nr:T. brucei spp.-specific protein [Trypanosoma brucei gambiense DAL972]CBH18600.1 T. brucei spp.-specific protein [Trypanosoma brucei gambiense DAL972]|eukprot:XP_011780864.1 T. brucei spp.-specific protein [Trypanosoma brucei gambiense DAL972]